MTVDTNNRVSHTNDTLLTIDSLSISSSWTYFIPEVPNILLVQYDSPDRKSVAIFKIISNSSGTSLSLIELLSIQNKNARLFRSNLLTKIILGLKSSNGYTALIRSYDFSSTSTSSIST
jgi:hypothetical protein